MVAVGTVATVLLAGVASLVMAWTIGAGSSGSTPFAPAVGANAIGVMRAGLVVGVLGFAGATLQGANVSETVGQSLVRGVNLSPTAAAVGLLTAATLVSVGVFTGYPIATAFTVTGAVVGVGIAAGGTPAWSKYYQIAGLWLSTPFVGGAAAYATARLLKRDRVPETVVVPALAGVVGLLLANVGFVFLGPSGQSASVARAAASHVGPATATGRTVVAFAASLAVACACVLAVSASLRRDVQRGQRRFLLGLGSLVAFTAGGSQVGLAIGPLVPMLDLLPVSLVGLLVGGGLGLLAGSWMGAPRMIKALARDYSALGPQRSIAALIPAFTIAQGAILFGIPVSFNEIIVSTIVGSGYTAGGGTIGRRKIAFTVGAWVCSLLVSLVFGYGAYTALATVA